MTIHKHGRYTSAKIVLVGESNVGKSCLAMRLAEDRYPEDHEHGTTHGMRFWPMEAEELHPAARAAEGQRRDVVLWDFGGQDEYQLVHQMFLHDTTLALVPLRLTRTPLIVSSVSSRSSGSAMERMTTHWFTSWQRSWSL